MLFTIINVMATQAGGEFKYSTPEEESEEVDKQVAYFKSKGLL